MFARNEKDIIFHNFYLFDSLNMFIANFESRQIVSAGVRHFRRQMKFYYFQRVYIDMSTTAKFPLEHFEEKRLVPLETALF